MSLTTPEKIRTLQRKLYRKAKEESHAQRTLAARAFSVCLTMKLVGKPDAEIGMSGLMSGDRKRSVAIWPKPPRLSSTLQAARSSRCLAARLRGHSRHCL